MQIQARFIAAKKDAVIPLSSFILPQPHHLAPDGRAILSNLPAGSVLSDNGQDLYIVSGHVWLDNGGKCWLAPLLRNLAATGAWEGHVSVSKSGWSVAIITLSDKGAAGLREDASGPAIAGTLRDMGVRTGFQQAWLLPDDPHLLRGLLAQLALINRYDLIITTGGTGVAERDSTPEAAGPLLDKELSGFNQAMIAESMAKTPTGIIARPCCGIIGKAILLTLPGSPKAVRENLGAVAGALDHALRKLKGDNGDCGGDK